MSDFSEDLIRPMTEDDPGGNCVPSGTGMYLPWLQKHIESVVTGGKKEKDFAQTTNACLHFIQEALLKHQWQQAAEYMHSYFQTLEDADSCKRQAAPEIIWKLGSEILYYHPKSGVETFNTFADRMKNIGVMNYLKISLQHALYLLHHGMFDDASRSLSQAETWRYGEKSSSQEVLINLIQAYKGLLQYYTWSKKKMELSKLDEDDYAYNTTSQNMLSHGWKTSVNLCALIQIPGVWDPFVKSYVEMLEFYGDQDGAREVLTNYAYDEKFPSNPNAHVYLYDFLKREKAPREKLISVLKILYQIVPSHKLMLEFHRLLRKSGMSCLCYISLCRQAADGGSANLGLWPDPSLTCFRESSSPGAQPRPFTYLLSVAALAPHQQRCTVRAATWLTKLKYVLSGPLQEKLAAPAFER